MCEYTNLYADMGQALSSNACSSTLKGLKQKYKHKCFNKVNISSTNEAL